ncbi:T9SS type A sorting domain-containing protein [Bacteroidota bacterium]
MKQFLLSVITIVYILLNSDFANAQITDVITNINQPTAIYKSGKDLYFGDFIGGLSKVDLSSSNPPITILTANGTYRTAVDGTDLYVSRDSEGIISKLDISTNNHTSSDIIVNLDEPGGLAINGNDLYFTEVNLGQICKINISQPNPIKTIVASGLLYPSGLTLKDNYLYIAEAAGQVSKLDITVNNPTRTFIVTNLTNATDIISIGNNLIVSDFGGSKVILIDLNTPTPTVNDLIVNINQPTGLFFDGTELYISVFGDSKIVKFFDSSLSLKEINRNNQKIKIFPNPSSKFIQVSGLTKNEGYTIYNTLGTEIKSGSVSNNDQIEIRNLNNGLYLLKLKDGTTMKFLKE